MTLEWPRAWIFLGVVLAASVASMAYVFRGNQGLLHERFKPPFQEGQPLADKILLVPFLVSFVGVVMLVPLDVFRLHLLPAPGPVVSFLGLVLFVAGWGIISVALEQNAFAAPVVRHQEERGHRVIDTGLYGVVRHPMYGGGALLMVGMPLWLESYTAALLAIVPIGTLVVRIVVEERLLSRELEGYDLYMKRVRYRLIPFVW